VSATKHMSTGGRRAREVADVVYRYSIGTQTFTTNLSDLFGLLGSTGMVQRASPDAFVAAYPVGSELMIRYSPARPALSVIQAGLDARQGVLIFMLGFLYW